MKETFRQSMALVHTWSGLLFGWLLFVVFACGTCAYFQQELTTWMTPEVATTVDPATAAQSAVRWLGQHAGQSTDWYISLPGKRSAVTTLSWSPAVDAPAGSPTSATLDGLGREIRARETAGGEFLYRFHFDLRYLPVIWARYLVGIAAIFMLVAIISGVVTHKKIFANFFMLRLGKGQRSWLDAHNVTAVLALPFHLMITYTGLVALNLQLSPGPVLAVYSDINTYYADSFPQNPVKRTGHPAALAPIAPMMAAAMRRWDGTGISYIYVANPGDAAARVTLSSDPGASMDTKGNTIQFDGVNGRAIGAGPERGVAQQTEGVMIGLHAGRYADTALRWLYFLSGLAGTLMVGSGLVLWTVKRRALLPDPARPHLGFRVVEQLNVGVVAGFPIGLAGHFLANRLLPIGLAGRAEWEIHCLFIGWGMAALVALLRPARRAWAELSALCAISFLAIPLASALATPRNLAGNLLHGEWGQAGVELVMIAFGLACALVARKLHLRVQAGPVRARDLQANAA